MATTRIHLTLERIRKLPLPVSKWAIYIFDDAPKHLAVRVTPAGVKSFVYAGKLNGTPFRITIGSVETWFIEDARAEARRLQTLVDAGRDPRQVKAEITAADEAARAAAATSRAAYELEAQRRKLTLGEAWAAYCEARQPKWGERNYRDHQKLMLPERQKGKRLLAAGVLASLGSLPLAEVGANCIKQWLDTESSRRATQAALGFRLLRAFLNWCHDHPEYRAIVQSGVCGSKAVRESVPKAKSKDDCLQREQLRVWFDEVRRIQNRRVSAYLQGMLLTGARPNELAALKWADVDFQWRSLTIRDKVESERTIPLTPYFEQLLRELWRLNQTPPAPYRILHGRKVANDRESWKPSEFVFSSHRSESGQIENAGVLHRQMLRNICIPNVALHGLRRSFATLSEWTETPEGIIAQIQGHKPSATREKHYKKRPLDLLRMWHTKIERWMLEQAGIEQPNQRDKQTFTSVG